MIWMIDELSCQNFNSQPHKEADGRKRWVTFSRRYFNSQPHKEADSKPYVAVFKITISTHSLTRRLTVKAGTPYPSNDDFNSQPHKEADGFEPGTYSKKGLFQLTASQGG